MSLDKKGFLKNEFATLSLLAGLATRKSDASIYTKETLENRRTKLKMFLRKALQEHEAQYQKTCSQETHYANIVKLAESLTEKFRDILRGGRFRIGIAQKILNLYLKYLWCAGEIPEPPHCPFDGVVLKDLGITDRWTKVDDITIYKEWATKAHQRAAKNGLSIAEWELGLWNKKVFSS